MRVLPPQCPARPTICSRRGVLERSSSALPPSAGALGSRPHPAPAETVPTTRSYCPAAPGFRKYALTDNNSLITEIKKNP